MGDPKCYILVRGRNAERYVERCLRSIREQTYLNYTILFVDDASSYPRSLKQTIESLVNDNGIVQWNQERLFSVQNGYQMIHDYCDEADGIVFNLDCDDWLASSSSLASLVKSYKTNHWVFTYGNCYIWHSDDLPLVLATDIGTFNHAYPPEVIKERSFRDYPFLPLHPRTFSVAAFKSIQVESFQRENKTWLSFCEDQAIFFPLLEMYATRCGVLTDPLTIYNESNPNSDKIQSTIELLKDELEIRRLPRYAPKDL
jgi:glycosyltransferase involved in cell wall biosynthesis